VVVSLVTGEEEKVGVLSNEVFDNEGAWSGVAGGITGKVSDDDAVLRGGFLADFSFEAGLVSVAKAVVKVF